MEELVSALIIEIARQIGGEIGNTGEDDYSDIATDDIVITLCRSELAAVLSHLAKSKGSGVSPPDETVIATVDVDAILDDALMRMTDSDANPVDVREWIKQEIPELHRSFRNASATAEVSCGAE